MHADRWRRAAPPVIESIAYRDEIGRGDVGSREGLVALGRSKLQNSILHRKNGVATSDLPLAVRPDTREGVAPTSMVPRMPLEERNMTDA